MSDIKSQFGMHLKKLREQRDLSISQLASKSGISRQHIRDLEMKEPEKRVTIVTIEKLAQGLEVLPWEMLKFGK